MSRLVAYLRRSSTTDSCLFDEYQGLRSFSEGASRTPFSSSFGAVDLAACDDWMAAAIKL
jgi:hypothetical protein